VDDCGKANDGAGNHTHEPVTCIPVKIRGIEVGLDVNREKFERSVKKLNSSPVKRENLLFPMRHAEKVEASDKLRADDRIILVRVKVERAKKHLRDLAAEVLSLEHVTILTPDPNTGVAPHTISLLHPNEFKQVPSLSFEAVAIAGDVVQNLRSALDHLAQQLVLVGLTVGRVHYLEG
jgi:hypothetical protein